MRYDTYSFLYPPRAAKKIMARDLDRYDNGEYIAQPKYDGDCSAIAISQDAIVIRNRHNEVKDHVDKSIDFDALRSLCPGWLVLAGEMLDKAKADEHGVKIKGFVVWDILVYDGRYLVNSTLSERIDLLDTLFQTSRMIVADEGMMQYNHLMFTQFRGIYRAPSYLCQFKDVYNDLIKTPLYEGIVLKKINAKLEIGLNANNNSGWQLKVRRATKNYQS